MQPNLIKGLLKRESMNAYTNWMVSLFYEYITGNVLEVGAGTGSVTSRYIGKLGVTQVLAVDIFDDLIKVLIKRFYHKSLFSCTKWNIEYTAPEVVLEKAPFDTIVCVNVLEHIKNDLQAVKQFYNLLSSHGKLVLLVPAHQMLYGGMDSASGHYRRYGRKQLIELLSKDGFHIVDFKFMNALGTVPWFVSGRVRKLDKVYSEHLSTKKLKLINIVAPILMNIERWIKPPFGLSLIAVAEK